MKPIRCYRILKTIMLGFILKGEQEDVLIDPDPNKMLEANEDTIWYVSGEKRYESTTTRNAIEAFLANEAIEEIVTQSPVEPLQSEPCSVSDVPAEDLS